MSVDPTYITQFLKTVTNMNYVHIIVPDTVYNFKIMYCIVISHSIITGQELNHNMYIIYIKTSEKV